MPIYLVEQDNEHALSMVKKMQDAGDNAYVICSRDELTAMHNGAVVVLPGKGTTQNET